MNNIVSKIAVVIPVYNGEKYISNAIKSLLKQKNFMGNNIEVIVVDDGSTDNTANIVKKFPITYIRQENSGPAKARNTGWRNSKAELILFTDSDCFPKDNWISIMCSSFKKGSDVVAGSYALEDRSSLLEECIYYEILYRYLQMPEYIKAFGSYNVAIRRNVLEEIGGFNENYHNASGEDNDLSYRIIKAGYKIYFQKDAKVIHNHNKTFLNYIKAQFRHAFWRMKLYKDYPDFMLGDDYTQWKDIVEPPLIIILIFSLFFYWNSFIYRTSLWPWLFLLIIQFILPFKIFKKEKKIRIFTLAGITFCRAFVRAIGMIVGIIKFKSYHVFFKRK